MAGRPGRGRDGHPGRQAHIRRAAEEGRRTGRTGQAAPESCPAGEGERAEGRRPGTAGKSTRALAAVCRERGLKREAEQVLDDLFPALERELTTTAACRLTGRS